MLKLGHFNGNFDTLTTSQVIPVLSATPRTMAFTTMGWLVVSVTKKGTVVRGRMWRQFRQWGPVWGSKHASARSYTRPLWRDLWNNRPEAVEKIQVTGNKATDSTLALSDIKGVIVWRIKIIFLLRRRQMQYTYQFDLDVICSDRVLNQPFG